MALLKASLVGLVAAFFLLRSNGSSNINERTSDSVNTQGNPNDGKHASRGNSPSSQVEILYQWSPSKCERKVKSGDFVRYHYYGMLNDGAHFDDSYARGRTYNTYIESGWLIPGMDQALLGMCVNEHRVVSIPPHLAYGEIGTDDIPGGATIFFNFILVDISNPDDTVQVIPTYVPDNCTRKLEDTDFVRYHYTGYLMNGDEFHSSHDNGKSYDTYVGKGWLIQGMDIGLIGACMQEKRTIIIPPHLGYGDKGDGNNIPPSAVIKFEVEILDFHNPKDNAVFVTLDSKFGTGDDSRCPRRVEETDFVRYHYNVSLVDKKVFDSSYSRGGTYNTYVGKQELIAGVDRGIVGTCVGETRRITVPPHIGYGEGGVEGKIPGSAVLIFEIYLIDVHNPKDDVNMKVLKEPPADCERKTKINDYITLEYDLELMDGTKLDSSKNYQGTFGAYNKPGNLILGLHKGVEGMCVGEIRKIVIPPHLGFGEPGGGFIPGSAVLVYTVELYKIEDPLPNGVLFMWSENRSQPDGLLKMVDDDSDGKVSLDELMSYVLREADAGNVKLVPGEVREKVVEQLFAIMDKNKDNSLQDDELVFPQNPEDYGVKDEL